MSRPPISSQFSPSGSYASVRSSENIHQEATTLLPPGPQSAMNSRRNSTTYDSLRPQKPSSANQFYLSPDPTDWGLDKNTKEVDDDLHSPEHPGMSYTGGYCSSRGIANLGCLAVLMVGIVGLFAGYPIASYLTTPKQSTAGAFNLGGTNGTGQVPDIGNFGLIDQHTPNEAYTFTSYKDNTTQMQLVFSDEFNTDGRSFYPGDDPYWEAVDLWYWETTNLNWYDPSAITTKNGSLVITLSEESINGLDYKSGMMSTWNKFCFTGGILQTSVVLPGIINVAGLWPAVWSMGNLGRAGYGATLDGMWPYTYDACDVGTLANQTLNGQPAAALTTGAKSADGVLSYLVGQRLSRCTCPGESHPGPVHTDGSYVGRSSPEIDVFEAQVTGGNPYYGIVSQSAQFAPFDASYVWDNSSANLIIQDPTVTSLNTYLGGTTQETTSCVTLTNADNYELGGANFYTFGFEYVPGFDNAYISWIANNQLAWTVEAAGVGANSATEISARPIPQEPMYIIVNLAISYAFGAIDLTHLTFPTSMYIDYIRVYQPTNAINIGCDPVDFPTADYINTYMVAYTNANLTTWEGFGQTVPKNNLTSTCSS